MSLPLPSTGSSESHAIPRVVSQCLDREDLDAVTRSEMFSLYSSYFDGVDERRFRLDLESKQWVIQLRETSSGRLVGFSTQQRITLPVGADPLHAIYSGDTIVAPAYWRETSLVKEFGRLAMREREAISPAPLHWFLISKGFRTYRFLPVFFREFYPCFRRPTPIDVKEKLDALGNALFQMAYDPMAGIYRAVGCKDRLRPELAAVEPWRRRDPHIRFFLEQNTEFKRGDELCCLTMLDPSNFTSAGQRMLASAQTA